jgi:hypothetical protein
VEFERQALVRSAKLEKADAAELASLEAELAELRVKQVDYSSKLEVETSQSDKVQLLQVGGGRGRQGGRGAGGWLLGALPRAGPPLQPVRAGRLSATSQPTTSPPTSAAISPPMPTPTTHHPPPSIPPPPRTRSTA